MIEPADRITQQRNQAVHFHLKGSFILLDGDLAGVDCGKDQFIISLCNQTVTQERCLILALAELIFHHPLGSRQFDGLVSITAKHCLQPTQDSSIIREETQSHLEAVPESLYQSRQHRSMEPKGNSGSNFAIGDRTKEMGHLLAYNQFCTGRLNRNCRNHKLRRLPLQITIAMGRIPLNVELPAALALFPSKVELQINFSHILQHQLAQQLICMPLGHQKPDLLLGMLRDLVNQHSLGRELCIRDFQRLLTAPKDNHITPFHPMQPVRGKMVYLRDGGVQHAVPCAALVKNHSPAL